jgi:hypothetical protein
VQNHSPIPQYIVRPQRHRGRLVGDSRRGGNYQGELHIFEVKDNELNRHVRHAELRLNGAPVIPALIEPQILRMTPALLVLAGWERLSDDKGGTQGYQQTWWCTPTFQPVDSVIPTPAALYVRGEQVR